MNIEQARGIAARCWCDPDMSHVEMDADVAEQIAQLLMKAATKQPKTLDEKFEEMANRPVSDNI